MYMGEEVPADYRTRFKASELIELYPCLYKSVPWDLDEPADGTLETIEDFDGFVLWQRRVRPGHKKTKFCKWDGNAAAKQNFTRKRLNEGSSPSLSVGKKKRVEYPSLLPEKIPSKSVKSDSKKRARDSDDEEYRAPKTRYKPAIDVNILQA